MPVSAIFTSSIACGGELLARADLLRDADGGDAVAAAQDEQGRGQRAAEDEQDGQRRQRRLAFLGGTGSLREAGPDNPAALAAGFLHWSSWVGGSRG